MESMVSHEHGKSADGQAFKARDLLLDHLLMLQTLYNKLVILKWLWVTYLFGARPDCLEVLDVGVLRRMQVKVSILVQEVNHLFFRADSLLHHLGVHVVGGRIRSRIGSQRDVVVALVCWAVVLYLLRIHFISDVF